MFDFGKLIFLLQDRCSAVFLVGMWNLGIQLKLSAVAHLAKLTKITFDLLQIQWHFTLSFWKNMQLENNILIFESQSVSCNKNGCCATSST